MAHGPLMLDLQGLQLAQEENELLKHPAVGGVILFSRNFSDVDQLQQLVREIRTARQELLIAVDQEGGRVQRFKQGFTLLPAMQKLGLLIEKGQSDSEKQLLHDCGWLMAAELMACDVDFSFAPVLDVDDCGCEVIADRSFNVNPLLASTAAAAFISGMHEAGMAATGKHFPGHGGVREDSHHETPYDYRSLDQIRSRDLIPFSKLAKELDAVMPAHIIFPEVDKQPVGFSKLWLQQILRKEMGFSGVIFSDDLSMKGADVIGDYAEKAHKALSAGCDMVLVCNNRKGAIDVVEYLGGQSLQVNPKLDTMKKRKHYLWSNLRLDKRWQRVNYRLNQLQEAI